MIVVRNVFQLTPLCEGGHREIFSVVE